jgi:hypothetical protein
MDKIHFNFNHVNIHYDMQEPQQQQQTKSRLNRISNMIFEILEEKIRKNKDADLDLNLDGNIYIERIAVPSIQVVDWKQNDYQIASDCASAIYLDLVKKLR